MAEGMTLGSGQANRRFNRGVDLVRRATRKVVTHIDSNQSMDSFSEVSEEFFGNKRKAIL